jgi:hypothetical protein
LDFLFQQNESLLVEVEKRSSSVSFIRHSDSFSHVKEV